MKNNEKIEKMYQNSKNVDKYGKIFKLKEEMIKN